MPRPTQSINEIISDVISQAMLSIVPAIQRHVAAMAAKEFEENLGPKAGRRGARGPRRAVRARRREIARWVADRRARRVPTFVIEMTGGLDTKKRIVAKFGENVAFEKGKPLPKPAK